MNLDELVSIYYSWGELELTTSPYGRLLDAMPLSLEEDIFAHLGNLVKMILRNV